MPSELKQRFDGTLQEKACAAIARVFESVIEDLRQEEERGEIVFGRADVKEEKYLGYLRDRAARHARLSDEGDRPKQGSSCVAAWIRHPLSSDKVKAAYWYTETHRLKFHPARDKTGTYRHGLTVVEKTPDKTREIFLPEARIYRHPGFRAILEAFSRRDRKVLFGTIDSYGAFRDLRTGEYADNAPTREDIARDQNYTAMGQFSVVALDLPFEPDAYPALAPAKKCPAAQRGKRKPAV